ncbi:hypothetical protein BV378_38605 [Nostoc sp. RF31YmG]|nr:hypothetical protein BV378_38605 [Nostoc sp. RF31YmG]OUL17699.1 hypothetical protein BV375_35415 [Nostoc sp. 106C]
MWRRINGNPDIGMQISKNRAHLKRDELFSQIFDDEYELALAVIHAIQNSAHKSNYSVKRFIFNHV